MEVECRQGSRSEGGGSNGSPAVANDSYANRRVNLLNISQQRRQALFYKIHPHVWVPSGWDPKKYFRMGPPDGTHFQKF